ncbi:PH domain-containing protein [Curtobacterium sp. MCPF17_052]|nr:PH domain-containing protein [Curtobacterium sp. MCPF17_052]WIB11468.1 PH domain-containing protein [Curtobacterium sp. MCPF17_052]
MSFRPDASIPAPPRKGDPAAAAPLTDGEWHRLHPLTPLLKGGIFLVVILGYVLNNLRDQIVEVFIPGAGGPQEDGDPVRYVYEHGVVGWVLLGVAVLLLVLIGLFYLSWRMHEFRVTGEIVEVRSGVVFRTHRKARLDRIQGINISRPLIPRVFGTAKLEVAQAGNDANVQLAYLGAKAADDLRQRILVLASGAKDTDQPRSAGPGGGVLQGRVDEFLAPELDPEAVHATRVVRVHPGRLIASMLLSGTTVVILLLVVAIIVSISLTGQYFLLVSLFPAVIGAGGYYVRKFSKSLRYTIADTRDGIRIGFGLFSTSNETLPPGRIHAVSVAQPLLWRPFGWWDIRINRATNAGNGASTNQQVSSIVLPVGTAAEVRQVLEIILPELVGSAVVGPEASMERLREGSAEAVGVVDDSLTTSGDRGGFRALAPTGSLAAPAVGVPQRLPLRARCGAAPARRGLALARGRAAAACPERQGHAGAAGARTPPGLGARAHRQRSGLRPRRRARRRGRAAALVRHDRACRRGRRDRHVAPVA